MTVRQPSIFLRGLILGAQGVFYNMFCTSSFTLRRYIVSADGNILASFVLPPFPESVPPFRRLSRGRSSQNLVSAISNQPPCKFS